MDTKLIECKLIDVPKVSGEIRTFSKEFAVTLADSLRIEGQLCPVLVRLNNAAPGRFILVAGRHRLYGMKNVLKEQFIMASIDETMDDAEAALAADTENLWRNPLNKAQHAGALKRWHANWLAKMPALVTTAAAPVAEGAEGAVSQTGENTETKALPAPVRETEADFDAKVAATTGQSLRSVARAKQIANAFTAEQLEVFTQMEVNQTDMTTIAKIKDENLRAEVVNLIASGMVVADAIKEVCKDAKPVRDNGNTTKAEREIKAAAGAEVKAELTDDEWFAENCGEKAAMLGDPTRFKSDALLYRSVTELRHAFRSKGKKFLAATKKAGNYGAFWNLLNRTMSISHPKDWLLCPGCNGQGSTPSPTGDGTTCKCGKCFGGGYLLKTEEYL
jgi:hypothetical protein